VLRGSVSEVSFKAGAWWLNVASVVLGLVEEESMVRFVELEKGEMG